MKKGQRMLYVAFVARLLKEGPKNCEMHVEMDQGQRTCWGRIVTPAMPVGFQQVREFHGTTIVSRC